MSALFNPIHDSHVHTRNILNKYGKFYNDLTSLRKQEADMEPKSEEVKIEMKFNHTVGFRWIERNIKTKPILLEKINSPFKSFSESNIEMFTSTHLYPEKWGLKMKEDLWVLRNCYLAEMKERHGELNCNSSQYMCIKLMNKLRSLSRSSLTAGKLLSFSADLYDHELNQLSNSLLNKKNCCMKTEFSEEVMKSAWLLDIIENINRKIKINMSVKMQNQTRESELYYNEGKRVRVEVYSTGQSIIDLEIEGEGIVTTWYISSTFSAFSYGNGTINIGDGSMIRYVVSMIDHEFTLNFIKEMAEPTEKPFIDYILSITQIVDTKIRSGLAGLYESTCLLMADTKGTAAALPILDNVLDSYELSPEYTEKLIKICDESDGMTCIKMSCIGKTTIYAEVSKDQGLTKYTQRTNRDHPVDLHQIEKLRRLFRMNVIRNYIKKYGRVPLLMNSNSFLDQELQIMAAGGNYNNLIVSEPVNYKDVRLGKMLEEGDEMNLESRIIDKACTKDDYDEKTNSIKELIYYIKNDFDGDFSRELKVNKEEYYNDQERVVKVYDRKDDELKKMRKYFIVRLAEKEKELKPAARFFGIASFRLKLWISSMMERVKRAMKLLPGQMMTMSEDERRDIMYKMSTMISDENCYSLFLDYSGHNTSQRPENTLFIIEEIANMYGYTEGMEEYDNMISIVYLFSNIFVINDEPFTDMIYYSKGQKGAIEGWFGPIWGIQSQLMLEDMLSSLALSRYLATTYSDDSCAVFKMEKMTDNKLNEIIKHVQLSGLKMGLLVKLSQTQVTNSRCSMLKEHYFKDVIVDTTYKRMMGISPNLCAMWGDELELVKFIDSGYGSASARSDSVKIQTIIRNYRFLCISKKEIISLVEQVPYLNMDTRYRSLKSFSVTHQKELLKEKISENEINDLVDKRDENTANFFVFNREIDEVKSMVLSFMYLPYTMYGYAMTPIPDAHISGYSLSNVKRIIYVQSLLSYQGKTFIGELINFNTKVEHYVTNQYPLTGGRFDTGTVLSDKVERILENHTTNRNLKKVFEMKKENNKLEFLNKLVFAFKDCFSARIAGKYYEESIFSYVETICSKVENSSTFMQLVSKEEMGKLWHKVWKKNRKIEIIRSGLHLVSYWSIVDERNNKEKTMNIKLEERIPIKLKFINIEEIPLLGALEHRVLSHNILPIFKGDTVLTSSGPKKHPPMKSHINLAKFDRDIGIQGLFQTKLIFSAYELTRYTKWIMMELERFSEISSEEKDALVSVCDLTLSTFSTVKFKDIVDYVVCPRGGRYFHRASAGGFNPRTGDLSSNRISGQYDVSGITGLIFSTGGEDNNLNLQYLITIVKVCMGLLQPSRRELRTLSIRSDILEEIKDVTFNLHGINQLHIGMSKKAMTLIPFENVKKKAFIYKSYSNFIAKDECLAGKFISESAIIPNEIIKNESSFINLYNYMEDQLIISPETIPLQTLKKIVPNLDDFASKEYFFEEFYNHYKDLNIIGNETPLKAITRSLINHELFHREHDSKSWVKELALSGFSVSYRISLLKLFVISCGLIFKVEDASETENIIRVNKQLTKINSRNALNNIRKGEHHFWIKDKKICNLLINAMPVLSYSFDELESACEELCNSLHGRKFKQERITEYYKEQLSEEIMKDKNIEYGFIDFDSHIVHPKDLENTKAMKAAIKGYEMMAAMYCLPKHVSSPTKSDIYPSARGLMSLLCNEKFINQHLDEKIIDLFGGRGDFHLAMIEKDINHHSVSRLDGYNTINRIVGMEKKKASWNALDEFEYVKYLENDIFLLDISHLTGTKEKLISLIELVIKQNKKVIMRFNTTCEIFESEEFRNFLETNTILNLRIPTLSSPGIIYLTIEPKGAPSNETLERSLKVRKFTDSVILERLTNNIKCMVGLKPFPREPENILDHTMETVSDDFLCEMILDPDSDVNHVPLSFHSHFSTKEEVEKYSMAFLSGTFIENNPIICSKLEFREARFISNDNCLYTETYNDLYSDDVFVRVNNKILSTPYVKAIKTFDNLNKSELEEIHLEIDNNKLNYTKVKLLWEIFIKIVKESDKKVSLNSLIDIINLTELRKEEIKAIDATHKIAKIACVSYKSGKAMENLILLTGMRRGSLNELMKHKGKTTRNKIMDYKLLINRIRLLKEKFNLLPRYRRSLIENEKWADIDDTPVCDEPELSSTELMKIVESLESNTEFDDEGNAIPDFFSMLVSNVKKETEKMYNISEEVIDPTTIPIFTDNTQEEIEANRNRSYEENLKLLENEGCDYEDEFEW
nr:TPA_asm: polymerase [Xerochrysum ophiovirus_visco]